MIRRAGLAPLLAIAACSPPKPVPLPPTGAAAPACQTTTLKALEGRPASAILAAEALALSGARTIRWIRPGAMVTQDFREDRLNVKLTGKGITKQFICG